MKTAFLFPGQGAQALGMGADLYDYYSIYKETFDACASGAGVDLKAACFDGAGMDASDMIQPAILAHSLATLAVLRNEGVDAGITAGLSLGEYSALAAAGVFEPAQCAALVRLRGHIMDGAFPPGEGGMLSVIGFDIDKVSEIAGAYDNVYVANHLAELQIVLAGYVEDLTVLKDVFQDAGAKMVKLLKVRGPSHAPLLSEASKAFMEALQNETLGTLNKTVYSNVLGKPYEAESNIRRLLADQMCERVKWHNITEHMIESGVECYVEVGSGNVLGKLVKRRVGRKGAHVMSVGDVASLQKFLKTYGENNE